MSKLPESSARCRHLAAGSNRDARQGDISGEGMRESLMLGSLAPVRVGERSLVRTLQVSAINALEDEIVRLVTSSLAIR